MGVGAAFQGCAGHDGKENVGKLTQAATTVHNVPWGTAFGNTPILTESSRLYAPAGANRENTLLTIPPNGVGCGATAPNGLFFYHNGLSNLVFRDTLTCAVSGTNCVTPAPTGYNFATGAPPAGGLYPPNVVGTPPNTTQTILQEPSDGNMVRLRDGSFLLSKGAARYAPTQAACNPVTNNCRWGVWEFFRSGVCGGAPGNWTRVSEIDPRAMGCPLGNLDGGLTYADPWSNRIFFIVPTWFSTSCTSGSDRFYVSTNNGSNWTYIDTYPFSHNYKLTTLPNGAVYLFAAGSNMPTPKLIRIDPNYNWASSTYDLPYTSANVTPSGWNGIQHSWGISRIGSFADGSERVRVYWPEVSGGRQMIRTTVVQAVGGGSGVSFTNIAGTTSKLYSSSFATGSLLEATMTETDRMEMTGTAGSPTENAALLSFLDAEKVPTAAGDVNFGTVRLKGAMARGSDWSDMIVLSPSIVASDRLDELGEYNYGSFWYDRVSRKLNFMSQFKRWDGSNSVTRTHVTAFGPLGLFTNFTQPLAGTTYDSPAIATTSTATTRLGLYTTGGGDRQLYYATKLGTGAWSAWEALGSPPGGIKGSPAAIYRGGSVSIRDIFVRDYSNREWHKPYYSSQWQPWELLPNNGVLTSDLAVTSWGTDRADLVARGQDGAIWHRAWDSANGWTTWHSLGGWFIEQTPAVVSWGVNRIDVFGIGGDNTVYHASCSSSCRAAADFSGWGDNQGGSFTGGLTASSPGPNRLDVFAKGGGKTFHKSWDPAIGGWTGWLAIPFSESLYTDRASAAAGSNGTTYVVQQGTGNTITLASSVTP